MERIKSYLLASAALVTVVLVLTLARNDATRVVADEFKDVRVINTESMPAKVRDVDNAPRHAVQARASCADDEGSCAVLIYVVPSGKRLVIEYASMQAHATGAQISRMRVSTIVAGEEISHNLSPTPPAPTVDSETTIGQVVRLYADPGNSGVGKREADQLKHHGIFRLYYFRLPRGRAVALLMTATLTC